MTEFRSPFLGAEHYEHRVQVRKLPTSSSELHIFPLEEFDIVKEAIMRSPDGLTDDQRREEHAQTLGGLAFGTER